MEHFAHAASICSSSLRRKSLLRRKELKIARWLIIAVGLAGSAWAQSSPLFVITLEGWDYGTTGQEFGFTPNPTVPGDLSPCLPAGDICGDPSIRLATGGDSQDESGAFTFDATGDGNYDFENTSGNTWDAVEITTTLTPSESEPGVQYLCDGGDIYQKCGFIDPDNTLDIYFYDPYPGGGITSSVPEPSEWVILALACAALVVVRARKSAAI
jgi:hypothetical protein